MKCNFSLIRSLFLMALMTICTDIYAKENADIYDVNINVILDEKGNARITETWDVEPNEGTEWYLVMSHLRKGMAVSNVTVSDETGKRYITDAGQWDEDRDLEEKAGHCGILKRDSDHYEVCWGLGSHDHHKYTVTYSLSNLVQSLNDYDAFNHMFLSDDLSGRVQHVKVTISRAGALFSTNDTKVWAFGTNKCHIELQKGFIVCESKEELNRDESVIIMARFNKSLFTPAITQNRKFKVMEDAAIEDSTYTELSGGEIALILGSITSAFVAFIALLSTWYNRYRRKLVFGQSKKVDGWCHDIPFDGNLFVTNYVMRASNMISKNNTIIGAIIMRWLQMRIISVIPDDNKKNISIDFDNADNESLITNNVEKKLFFLMKEASGEDLILEQNELESFIQKKKGFKIVESLQKDIMKEGERVLVENEWAKRKKKNSTDYDNMIFTEKGMGAACKMAQYYNYLKGFTNMDQRDVEDISVTGDTLVFATLFGIADKVFKGLQELYPQGIPEEIDNNLFNNNNILLCYLMINHYNNGSSYGSAQYSGGGSTSSFGGGGGFSGGGGGGCR